MTFSQILHKLRHCSVVLGKRTAITLVGLLSGPAAFAADPELPPGNDPGGVAVALISTGIDYTDAAISKRLARDGEGEIVGWDFVDNDNRPFANLSESEKDPAGSGTKLAKLILEVYKYARLVPVRINPADPKHFAQAIAFVMRTPARIVALPYASLDKERWQLFATVATQARNLLIVVPAGDKVSITEGKQVWPAALKLANGVVVAPMSAYQHHTWASPEFVETAIDVWVTARGATVLGGAAMGPAMSGKRRIPNAAEAVAMIAGQAACAMHNNAEVGDAAAIKSALLALGHAVKGSPSLSVHDGFCLYSGVRFP